MDGSPMLVFLHSWSLFLPMSHEKVFLLEQRSHLLFVLCFCVVFFFSTVILVISIGVFR